MGDCDEKELEAYVEKWEELIDDKRTEFTIKQLMSEHLFRIRKWTKGDDDAYYFNKDEIVEFKGFDYGNSKFGYAQSFAMNMGIVEQIKSNKLNQLINITVDFPFSITQKIINGKYFFEYVFYFHKLYQDIFKNGNEDFKQFYKEYCEYSYSHRTGDYYVRNLYKNVLLYFCNHFNKEVLEEYYKAFYKHSYKLRLTKRVSLPSVLKNIEIFREISNSYNFTEFNY